MAQPKLTPTQQSFLKLLFGKAQGNLRVAAEELGIDDYSVLLTDALIESIKQRADNEIVANVPKAIFTISKILEDPQTTMYFDKLHKVCADVLDRAGLSRQDRVSQGGTQLGLVFLPNKMALLEPPIEKEEDNSGIQTEETP